MRTLSAEFNLAYLNLSSAPPLFLAPSLRQPGDTQGAGPGGAPGPGGMPHRKPGMSSGQQRAFPTVTPQQWQQMQHMQRPR